MTTTDPLLRVADLTTRFRTDEGVVRAVDGVSFDVRAGETVCLVGESGSGKTVTAESITRLIERPPGEISGTVRFRGEDLADASERRLRELRGAEIGHVFQNPQDALNPVYTVGRQVGEVLRIHEGLSRRAARARAIDLLDRVEIPDPAATVDAYPHELSGGMKQRVLIAVALAGNPDLLIADEPTTALDVTIQAGILDLLADLQDEFGMAVLFITHDLGVVARIADRVVVLYAGKVMERGPAGAVFRDPAHPYTRALLACLPGRGETSGSIRGELPDPTDLPDGCRFAPRCPFAVEDCHGGAHPDLVGVDGADDHEAACLFHGPGYDRAHLDRTVAWGDAPDGRGRADGGRPDDDRTAGRGHGGDGADGGRTGGGRAEGGRTTDDGRRGGPGGRGR
ncbi:MAG: ABC transporter ATP-binding protein [Haloferacaceae archaeon]